MGFDEKIRYPVLDLRKAMERFRQWVGGNAIRLENSRDWERTFDAIDDWICIIDLDATILRSNKAVERFFRVSVQESIGLKSCRLLHGTDAPIEKCPLQKMVKRKKRVSAEIKINDDCWMLITVDPIFNRKGKMTRAVHMARDITQRIVIRNERKKLVRDLEQSLKRIKTLSGLLPICSHCKKIRDDKGYWRLIESYIEKHSNASFSHGMCPECTEKLYGGEAWYIQMKKRKNNVL